MDEKNSTALVPNPKTDMVRKPFGDTSIEELTGVKAAGGDVVLVNLNRAAMVINCGSANDFLNGVQMCAGIKAAVWNEDGITLALADRYSIIKYEPPIHQMAKMFFETKGLHDRRWKGNYEPVVFTKKDLIQFLKEANVVGGTEEIVQAIKNMKLKAAHHETDMISLDEEKSSILVEDSLETNLPKRFSLMIPVTPDFIGEFKFEVRVENPSDRDSSSDAKQRKIALHCLNPLEIRRAAVKHVLDQMPNEIPRIYGDMKITTREHW